MNCERCGTKSNPKTYELFDYCALCSKNLCPKCMADGCCRSRPAKSGIGEDHSANVTDTDATKPN